MSLHPVIEQLAQLVREEPSITVSQLAKKMGYAEQKSIYYWLDKAGYRSIRMFRDAVLTGRFPPGDETDRWPTSVREDEKSLPVTGPIPIVDVASPGVTRARGITVEQVVRQQLSPAGFSFVLPSDDYVPLLLKGDLLLIEPTLTPPNGALVLAWKSQGRTTGVYRHHQFSPSQPSRLYHPVTGQEEAEAVSMLGIIMGSLRIFRSFASV